MHPEVADAQRGCCAKEASPSQHPHPPSNTPLTYLIELREIVASEGYAMTALTLASYRANLLETINHYIRDCTP